MVTQEPFKQVFGKDEAYESSHSSQSSSQFIGLMHFCADANGQTGQ